jgi:hypothetical protein
MSGTLPTRLIPIQPPRSSLPLLDGQVFHHSWLGFFRNIAIAVNKGPVLRQYTVATLPAVGNVGDWAFVTDATSPGYNLPVVGGGGKTIPVFYDGTGWMCR